LNLYVKFILLIIFPYKQYAVNLHWPVLMRKDNFSSFLLLKISPIISNNNPISNVIFNTLKIFSFE